MIPNYYLFFFFFYIISQGLPVRFFWPFGDLEVTYQEK